jgi:hypothetical protein
MSQCVARDLPRTSVWRVIWKRGLYSSSRKVEWLVYSIYRPTVDDIFDGNISFDISEHSLEIEGPFDFFRAGVMWPGRRIVFLPSEVSEPSNMLPVSLDMTNYADYLNICNQCSIVIGGKQEYFCEECQAGTCIKCNTNLIEASSEDPEEEDYLLCETCDGEYILP